MKDPKVIRKLGIWLDHQQAHMMEYIPIESDTEMSSITNLHLNDEAGVSQNENVVHNKEQRDQAGFYKKLADKIVVFDEVILFGPTDAKLELLNILKEDHHFDKIKTETIQADKMSENQQMAFVKAHFSAH